MKILKIILGLFILLGTVSVAFADTAVVPRWNKNLIMVYIPNESSYAPAMQKAFQEWQSQLPSKIQFYITSSERDKRLVEVDVNFNILEGEDAKNSGSTILDGTNFYRHGSISINAVYKEDIENDPKLKAQNDALIYQVMLREVGKLLGLPDSSNPKSVMNAKLEEGQTVLPEDIQRVCERYGWVK